MQEKCKPIPIILDTDIGGDIDDTWALAMLLKSPECDVKLVVSDTADTTYRAKLIAKLLTVAGRTDIPVGVGLKQASDGDRERQAAWVEDYELTAYPGTVHEDGVQAIIDTIMASPEPVSLVCIGPVTNIAEALRREPAIASKTRFVGMHGSVRKGYDGSAELVAEWNVKCDVPSAQAVFAAPWASAVITPLDTCGVVRLKGEKYRAVASCDDPLTRAVIENYRIWLQGKPDDGMSSVLFDTVAIYLIFTSELLVMERVALRVDDKGFTREDPGGRAFDCALDWRDMGAFEDLLVTRLTRTSP